jgi:hypothetical protein
VFSKFSLVALIHVISSLQPQSIHIHRIGKASSSLVKSPGQSSSHAEMITTRPALKRSGALHPRLIALPMLLADPALPIVFCATLPSDSLVRDSRKPNTAYLASLTLLDISHVTSAASSTIGTTSQWLTLSNHTPLKPCANSCTY